MIPVSAIDSYTQHYLFGKLRSGNPVFPLLQHLIEIVRIPKHHRGICVRNVEVARILIRTHISHTHPRRVRKQVMQIERVVRAVIDEVGLLGAHLQNGARVQGARVVGIDGRIGGPALVSGVVGVLDVAGSVVVLDVVVACVVGVRAVVDDDVCACGRGRGGGRCCVG